MVKRRAQSHDASTKNSPGTGSDRVHNAVLTARKSNGLSQAELARHAGITRQALHAIETNQHLPHTSTALRLARALACRVEDLFALPDEQHNIQAELIGAPPNGTHPMRVAVSAVGDRWIARPLADMGDMMSFLLPADGIVSTPPASRRRTPHRVTVNLLRHRDDIARHIVIAGCDPSLFLAGEHLRHLHALGRVMNCTAGSTQAIRAVLHNDVHIAGLHLVDARTGESNLPYLKRHVPGEDFMGVRFASWTQGLMIREDSAQRIRAMEDLAQRGLRFINRERGSGARLLLDAQLKRLGLSPQRLDGYEREVGSHLDVARHIRDTHADAGIGVESAARHYGLAFIPLRDEQYDLVVRKETLASHPLIATLFDTLVSRPFRRDLQAVGGYNLADIGKTLTW